MVALTCICGSETISGAPARLVGYEEEQQWLHAVIELNGTLDALDESSGSELATVVAFNQMNNTQQKHRNEFNSKYLLPALYSHLYLKSEWCWDMKPG